MSGKEAEPDNGQKKKKKKRKKEESKGELLVGKKGGENVTINN